MCQALQELREDFINEGKREGRQEGRRAQQCYTIEMMLNKNYDLAEICSIAGCDPALVEKVREKKVAIEVLSWGRLSEQLRAE